MSVKKSTRFEVFKRDKFTKIQDRRDQLEMLMEWHRSLMELDKDLLSGLNKYWQDLTSGYSLNDRGLQFLRKWLDNFQFEEVVEAMRIACTQYLKHEVFSENLSPTQESVEHAFSKIPGICHNRKEQRKRPYLKDLYYIRGILRNRMPIDSKEAVHLMEEAVLAGITVDQIKAIALTANSWADFYSDVWRLI